MVVNLAGFFDAKEHQDLRTSQWGRVWNQKNGGKTPSVFLLKQNTAAYWYTVHVYIGWFVSTHFEKY